MASNPFRIAHREDIYRQLIKTYPYQVIDTLSYMEQIEYLLATSNDTGFEYETKTPEGQIKFKRDYPYLIKNG